MARVSCHIWESWRSARFKYGLEIEKHGKKKKQKKKKSIEHKLRLDINQVS